MIKNKLRKLKAEEEKAILSEHEGLYRRLVAQNYRAASPAKKVAARRRLPAWAMGLAASFLSLSIIFVATFAFILVKSKGSDKNLSEAPQASITLEDVGARLENTTLASWLKLKSITPIGGGVELEVSTFNTLELTIMFGGEEIGGFLTGEVESAVVNGLGVSYSVCAKHKEDYYDYSTRAVVDGGSEKYYIVYDYKSVSPECELMLLIGEIIERKV